MISLSDMNSQSRNISEFDFVLVAFKNKSDTIELDTFLKNLYHLQLIVDVI